MGCTSGITVWSGRGDCIWEIPRTGSRSPNSYLSFQVSSIVPGLSSSPLATADFASFGVYVHVQSIPFSSSWLPNLLQPGPFGVLVDPEIILNHVYPGVSLSFNGPQSLICNTKNEKCPSSPSVFIHLSKLAWSQSWMWECSVNSKMFRHTHIDGFVYEVLTQTLLGIHALNDHSEIPKSLNLANGITDGTMDLCLLPLTPLMQNQ